MGRTLIKISAAILLLLAGALGAAKLVYGGATKPFPDMRTEPGLKDPRIELVATFPDTPPGNIAVAPDGRVFFNYHPDARPEVKVAELVDGKPIPWPSADWQQPRGAGEPFFDAVFSVRIDRQGRLWTIDHGFHGLKQPRVLAFDLATGKLVHRWDVPADVAPLFSLIQDLQISPDGKWIYIADVGALALRPGLIVYDVTNGKGWRRLSRHDSAHHQPYGIRNGDKPDISLLGGLYKVHPALDSIVLDRQGEWLYYGPMAGDTLWRVRAADLRDATLSDPEVGKRVEAFAKKPQSDGLTIDDAGNIYVTAIEYNEISLIDQATRTNRSWVRDSRWRWPDGMSFAPGGWIYVTDSNIPGIMLASIAKVRAQAPYHIYRFQSGQTATPGH